MVGRKQIGVLIYSFVVFLQCVVVERIPEANDWHGQSIMSLPPKYEEYVLKKVLYAVESAGRSSCTCLSFEENRAGNGIS